MNCETKNKVGHVSFNDLIKVSYYENKFSFSFFPLNLVIFNGVYEVQNMRTSVDDMKDVWISNNTFILSLKWNLQTYIYIYICSRLSSANFRLIILKGFSFCYR